jgi:hypothetical protein
MSAMEEEADFRLQLRKIVYISPKDVQIKLEVVLEEVLASFNQRLPSD